MKEIIIERFVGEKSKKNEGRRASGTAAGQGWMQARFASPFVIYQGGPPSAHATPIRLPNGQLVTHKRMYFDIRKPGNPFYDSDFFERKNATMRVRYLFHSRFQTLSVACSRQFNYHE